MKSIKNWLILFLAVFLIVSIPATLADLSITNMNVRPGETKTQEINFEHGEINFPTNITFSMVNVSQPQPGIIRDSVTTLDVSHFSFSPEEYTIQSGTSVLTTLSIESPDDVRIGTYSVTAKAVVTNASGVETEYINSFTVITQENQDPIIEDIDDVEAIISNQYSNLIEITDPEGDELNVELINAPSGMTLVPPTTGNNYDLRWLPTSPETKRVVTLRVTDAFDAFVDKRFNVSAAYEDATLSIDTIKLGGENQQRDVRVTKTFTIANTGSEDITNLEISSLDVDADYNITLSQGYDSTLGFGDSTSITLSVLIPVDQDAGEEDIGTLRIDYNADSEDKFIEKDILLEVENFLELSDVDYDINDGDDTGSLDTDETDSFDAAPGDTIVITVKIDNIAEDSCDGCRFRDDIDLDLDISELDIEESETYTKNLDQDETSSKIEFSFELPDDEDGTFDGKIEITGEDENNAEHVFVYEFEVTLEKPDHEIKIQSLSFLTDTVKQGRTATLQLRVENTGSDDEDEVIIRINNNDLELSELLGPYSIDEDDDLSKTVTFEIPEDAEEREYVIQIETYYEGDEESDSEYIILSVISSEPVVVEDDEEQDSNIVIEPDDTTTTIPDAQYGTPIQKDSLFGDNGLVILLIVFVVVLIGVIVVIMIPKKRT